MVGFNNGLVWVKVEGTGTFLNSAGIKDFAKEMIQRGHREFVIDLERCPVMDSTFMGTLAGIALRLKEIGQGKLHVVQLNPRNSGLLKSLGLDQLFGMETPGLALENVPEKPVVAAPTAVGNESKDEGGKEATARVMLEAHEALVEASSGNLSKFKDVLDFLKQDLQQSR